MNIYFQTMAGREIYRSTEAVIQQNFRYRWLMFQNASRIQTLVQRKQPQRAAMPYLVPFTWPLRTQPGPTCLLGLGGGAVVHMIAPYLSQHPIIAVEQSAEVITLGRLYFGLNTMTTLTISHSNAQLFFKDNTQYYKHILIDLYSDTGFPQECNSPEFFSDCKQALDPQGFLVINLVGMPHELAVLEQIKTIFPQATVCIPVPNSANMIVVAAKSKSILMALIDTHPHLKAFIWDPIFGYMAKLA
jgi:spermidine synthase